MKDNQDPIKTLERDHSIENIKLRLSRELNHSYLGDFILGAVDGTVTTFTLVAGVAGAGLNGKIAIILGFCNLVGDGISMAAGNYLKARADEQLVEKARREEENHIDMVPEGEKEELRQIFARKGLSGPVLEEVVQTIASNKGHWVDTMLKEELGLKPQGPNPRKVAFMTFISFFLVGLVPLLPFLLMWEREDPLVFRLSAILTGLSFFMIGFFKGKILDGRSFRGGLETFFVGGLAALLAYGIGFVSREFFNL